MNKSFLLGRLVRDPEIRYAQTGDGEEMPIANFRLAVDRKFAREGDPTADFFTCTAFWKKAEFIEKYFFQGSKILLTGRMQNDNYETKDGEKVYSVRFMVDEAEFVDSKKDSENSRAAAAEKENTPARDDAGRRGNRSRQASGSTSSGSRGRSGSESPRGDMSRSRNARAARQAPCSSSSGRSQSRSRSVDEEYMDAAEEEACDFD